MSWHRPRARLFVFWFRDVGGDWIMRTDTSRVRLRRELGLMHAKEYATTKIVEYRTNPRALEVIFPGRYRGKVWPR